MTISIPNPTIEEPVPAPPVKADGSAYRYEMIHDTTRTFADTATELVTALIPQYAELDAEARAQARLTFAVGVQVQLQAILIMDGDLTTCRAEHCTVLLGNRTEQPDVSAWDAPIPLVLVASYYQPYTSLRGPVAVEPSEVIWLDPSTDHTLLSSLAHAGVIGLAEHGEPTDEAATTASRPTGDRGQE